MKSIRNEDHRQPPAHDGVALDGHAHDEHAFDQAMRRRYSESLLQLPSGIHARLRAARHAAAIRTPARMGNASRSGWKLTGALAAVFAVALGLSFFSASLTDQTVPDAAPSAVVGTSTNAESTVSILDESPDMYLWLAANDDALPALLEP